MRLNELPRSVSSQINRVSARSELYWPQLPAVAPRPLMPDTRILDFMASTGHGGDRTRAAAVVQLPLHFFGQRALLKGHDETVLPQVAGALTYSTS